MTTDSLEIKRGRPKTATAEWPVFGSMAACASSSGIPLPVLKAAKAAGCPAFVSTRVETVKLLPWLFSRDAAADDAGVSGWREELAKWQAKREKIKHDKDAGTVADMAKVRSDSTACMSALFEWLDQTFVNELPPAMSGLEPLAACARAKEEVEKFKDTVRVNFERLGVQEERQTE
jgi:hypothetical protein